MPRKPDQGLSEKQEEVLKFIYDFVEKNGFQPSQLEMAEHLGVTKNAVTERLKSLEKWGVIEMPRANRERAILLKHVVFRAEPIKAGSAKRK